MSFHLFDTSLGVLIYGFLIYGILALAFSIGLFLLIAFVEGVILRFLNWGDMWQSMLDSIMVNFVTTIVGILLAITVLDVHLAIDWFPDNFGEILPKMILLWALTVLVEGVLLGITRRRSFKETWGAAFIVNTCSYAIILAIMPLFNFGIYL